MAYWEYEPKDRYLRRQANQFVLSARKNAFEEIARNQYNPRPASYDPSTNASNPMFGKNYITPKDIDEIIKPASKKSGGGGGIGGAIKGALGAVDDVSSAVFGGEVRQPWDVLRPVQRAFEAEQKYIAIPLARTILGPLPGSYDDLPSAVRFAAETILSPSTYLTPALASKVLKTAPMLAKNMGQLSALAPGLGSQRALLKLFDVPGSIGFGLGGAVGGEVTQELGLGRTAGQFIGGGIGVGGAQRLAKDRRAITYVVAPEDSRVFHGTAKDFEGLPQPQTGQKRNYDTSLDGALYTSPNPDLANTYAKSKLGGPAEGGRVIPAVIKKGTKVFNPDVDQWPDLGGFKENMLANTAKSRWARVKAESPGDTSFLDTLFGVDEGLAKKFTEKLRADGYKVVDSGTEKVGIVDGAFEHAYTGELFPSLLADDAPKWDALTKQKANPAAARATGAGAAKSQPEFHADTMAKLNDEGLESFAAETNWEVMNFANAHRSMTQNIRDKVGRYAPAGLVDRVERAGMRLNDTDLNIYVDNYQRKLVLGGNAGAVIGNLSEGALKKSGFQIREIAKKGTTVTNPELVAKGNELGLLDSQGNLYIDDLINRVDDFELDVKQTGAVGFIKQQMDEHYHLEEIFDLKLPKTVHASVYGREARSATGAKTSVPMGRSTKKGITITEGRTHAQLVDEGMEVGGFSQSQVARVAEGYKAMADKWLNAAVDHLGKKPVDLLPPNFTKGYERMSKVMRQSREIEKSINKALRSKKGETWEAPKFRPDEALRDIFRQATKLSTRPTYNNYRREMTGIKEIIKDFRKTAMPEWNDLQAKRKALEADIARGASPYTKDVPASFQGKFFEAADSRTLQKFHESQNPSDLMKSIQWVNNQVRPIMATLDLSFMGVQGSIVALSDPLTFFKTAKVLYSRGYDDYFMSLQRTGELRTMIQDGVHIATRNDMAEFIAPAWLANKVPGAQLSNTAFTQFGNILRAELYRTGTKTRGKALTKSDRRELARTANLVSGFNPGSPTSIEKTLLFAPRFFRSQLGFISDAVTTNQLKRKNAAEHIFRMMTVGTITTLALNEILGNPTDIRPLVNGKPNSNFMRVRFGEKDFSVFGPMDSLLRIAMTTVTEGPDAAALFVARTKASPVLGRAWDLIEGQTFGGSEFDTSSPQALLESVGKFALSSAPISIQNSLVEGGPPTNLKEGIVSGLEFLGPKATPTTKGERLKIKQEELAKEIYDVSWHELEPHQKFQLRQNHDLTLDYDTEISRAFNLQQSIGEDLQDRLKTIDEAYPAAGPEWVDAYYKLKDEQRGRYNQWSEDFPDAADRISTRSSKNPLENKRLEYLNIFQIADQEKWSSHELSARLNQFDNSLTTNQKEYIDRNLGLRDSPRVKEFKKAQDTLRPYWQFEDQVWEKMRGRLPEGSQHESLDDYIQAKINEQRVQGVPDSVIARRVQSNNVFKQIEAAVQQLRRRFRQQNSDVDNALIKWYGYQQVSRIRG